MKRRSGVSPPFRFFLIFALGCSRPIEDFCRRAHTVDPSYPQDGSCFFCSGRPSRSCPQDPGEDFSLPLFMVVAQFIGLCSLSPSGRELGRGVTLPDSPHHLRVLSGSINRATTISYMVDSHCLQHWSGHMSLRNER